MATSVSVLRSTEDLVAYVRAGGTVDYLHFWGHQPDKGTGLGAGCLSQWWPVKFTVDGVTYPTAEHYMMAGKAALFGDDEMGARILRVTDPAEAKRLGREVRGFDRPQWSKHRSRIVVDGNLAKFGQTPALRDFLLGTGERVLVEAVGCRPLCAFGLSTVGGWCQSRFAPLRGGLRPALTPPAHRGKRQLRGNDALDWYAPRIRGPFRFLTRALTRTPFVDFHATATEAF